MVKRAIVEAASKLSRKRASREAAEEAAARKRARLEIVDTPRQRRRDAGIAFTFSQGDFGQLGLGERETEKLRPAAVGQMGYVVAVCAGGMHTVCLASTGKVYTFG